MNDEANTLPVTLAAIRAGESFEVMPDPAGGTGSPDRHDLLRAGNGFFCRATGSATILLVGEDRRTISVPLDVARFIEVRRTSS